MKRQTMKTRVLWFVVFLFGSLWPEVGIAQDVDPQIEAQPPASKAEVEEWIQQLASADYNTRIAASSRLAKSRDAAVEQTLRHCLSTQAPLASAAECLKLMEAWLEKYDAKFHERVSVLIEQFCADSDYRQHSRQILDGSLNESLDCSESEAIEIIKTMGASVYWIEDENYLSIHVRGDCRREDGNSLWPLRNINLPCHILFENVTVDDFTARNLAQAPGLKRIFCPYKMTEEQVAMLGESNSLRDLYIRRPIQNEVTMTALARIPTLQLLSFDPEQPVELFQFLKEFPALETVHANRGDLTDPRFLDHLADCPKLQRLSLGVFKLPGKQLTGFDRFKNVKSVELPRYCDDDLIKNLADLPALESMEIDYACITDKVSPYLAVHTNLKELVIEQTFISDETCEQIAKLKNLKSVKLDGTFVTPVGVRLIELANPGLKVDGWITAAHDPKYVQALQQLRVIGAYVSPDFSVSFSRDDKGNVILPYKRVPGCDVHFTVSEKADINQQFLQYLVDVDDLKKLYLKNVSAEFGEQLLLLPRRKLKVGISASEITEELQQKIESHFDE